MPLEDFIRRIRQKVYPGRNREMHLEHLQNSYDFKKWIQQPDMAVLSGLCPTVYEPHVAHSWRLIRRAVLTQIVVNAQRHEQTNVETMAAL